MLGHIHCEFRQTDLDSAPSITAVDLFGINTRKECFDKVAVANGFSRIFSAPASSPLRNDLIYRKSYHEEEALMILAYILHGEERGKVDVYTGGDSKIPYGYKLSFTCPISELYQIRKAALQFVPLDSILSDKNTTSSMISKPDPNFAFHKLHVLVEEACRAKTALQIQRVPSTPRIMTTPCRTQIQPRHLNCTTQNRQGPCGIGYPQTHESSSSSQAIPKLLLDPRGPKRCHNSNNSPLEPIPINWGVRPVVGLARICRRKSEVYSQEAEDQLISEANAATTSSDIERTSPIPDNQDQPATTGKRKPLAEFNERLRDMKHFCVDQHNLVRGPHFAEDIFDGETHQDTLGHCQEAEPPKGAMNHWVTTKGITQNTGPSWQDLRRLPCGRVCFDPEFYGC